MQSVVAKDTVSDMVKLARKIDESAFDVDTKYDNRKDKDRGHWCKWHPW